MPDTDTILDEPEVDQEQDQPQPDQQPPPAPSPEQPQGPGPQQPSLKDEDKQKLVKIITNMQKAGESDDNIKAVVKRYQELNTPKQTTTPVDQGIRATDKSLNQPIQFNGTFKPDLEGEKKGLYTNDPDYQKQKNDFVQRIATDANGKLLYPEQDQTSGQWFNYYTKQPIPNFDPRSMRGAILQVPHEYLPATGGEKFITAKYDSENGSYSFPSVQTPDVPTVQNLPQATVYGKKGAADQTQYSGAAGLMVNESDKQGGELRNVLKAHPELSGQIDETLAKYGPEYSASLATGHDAMSNVLQKTVEDHYDLNKPLPANVDAPVLDGHLNVLNNFEKNRQSFELNQRELQRQADLLTDRAKRTGEPVSQEDAEKLAQKASQNIQQWNEYSKSVNFSQNYVNQPEVKNYLDEFKKRQQGIQLIDELRQRAFPDEVNASMKQDAYDRKAIEGNLNAWDYTKTALGKAGSALANIGETALKGQSGGNPLMNTAIEGLNNSAQDFLKSNLNAISPEAVDQMNKLGIGHLVNDLSSTVGGIAPYVIPGAAWEGLGAKAATFATALAEGLPDARKEAEKQGLTGAAYNTYVAAKPLVSAAFMTMLPNVKFAKGFENDIAKAVVDGEFNNPKRALLNLASKVVTVHPGDVAHLQAMLSGTALGEALVNKVANGLQATENLHRGISQTQDLPTELSNVFNPRQTAVMALTGKLLEAVPTLKNSIGELSKGKDIQSTYDHIQNNLVELAGHNLEGVSKQVNALVQKDPGNIYAQHLKTTLEDFAHSEARMPEGLAPEQKAALFDVQKQILQKQRQMAYADPVYQPHLQKNIDELNKQIPDILKDPKKANDYLVSGHKDFAREILNTDADEKLLKGNKEKDLADLKDRESALDPKSTTYAVKKEALEKERAETEDYYDSRLKNISSPKTENNGKNKNAPPEAEGQQGQISEKPTEGAEPNNLLMDRTAPSIQPESWARTLDYGNNKGKEETTEAQDKIKDEILNDKPIGENGEKFSQLLGRVIPGVQKVMKEDPHNTAIVTHSSVIKALDVWEEMGRPDVSELKGDKLKEFAQKYIDLKPEAEGKVHTFKGEDGKEIKVIRHGETEDNVASEFREDNTKLTDKGEAQAARAGDNLIKETGGNIPKIISSDLPRTMHTSDIINQKFQENDLKSFQKDVSEMTSDELREYAKDSRKLERTQEDRFFGKEGADRYRKLRKTRDNPLSDRKESSASSKEMDAMEDSLTPEQQKEFFGGVDRDTLLDAANQIHLVEQSNNVQELAKSIKRSLLSLNSKTPEKETLAILNAAKRRAYELGINPEELVKASMKNIASDLIDSNDAIFLIKEILSKLVKSNEYAIPKQISGKVGLRDEAAVREGVGGQNGSEQPTTESGQSGQPTEEKQKDSGKEKVEDELPFIDEPKDDEFTSTKNAVVKKKIEEAGLKQPMEEAAREFGTVWKDAQEKLAKGFDIEKLVKSLDNKPRAVTDLENAMILFHQNVKEAQLDSANKDIAEATEKKNEADLSDATDRRAKLLDDLQTIYNVDKKIGRETARGLNARKMMADRRFSLVNMQLEKRAATGGEPLTDAQTEQIKQQYEEIKKTKEALDARIAELEKENARLAAQSAVSEGRKGTGRARKSKQEFTAERKDLVKKMREDLLKAAKGAGGLTSSIPFAAQLKAVAPHIANLVKSFIEEGVDKLEDITKNIYDLLKPEIPDLEERHVHDLIAGVYNEPQPAKEPSAYQQVKAEAKVQKYRATDPKTMKLQADYERAKEKYEQSLKVDERKSRSVLQKAEDVFLKYERFAKLSNPITLGKLAMAAITRLATTPIEEGIGAIYTAGLPGIAKKAPGEAGANVSALAKGYKASFMRGLDDAATVAKGGKTDIESVFGKKGQVAPEALDFFGQLHSAIKAPVKRFAFERSFQKRIANNIKNGVTIDGLTEARIAVEAYKDAQRSIFMQDNLVAKGWRGAMNALEKHGPGGELAATIGQWLIPFVKVPSNIIGETISHVAGPEIALTQIIAKSLGKGLKSLTQDEAESIMRNLKKGTIGHVALMAGYLNPQVFGGYYQKGEKRDEKDAKVGAMKIGDTRIPAWALEAPLFQAMQIGATVRRIKDTMVKGESKGLGEGIWGGAMGLVSHEPLLDEPSRLAGSLTDEKERGYFFGELAKSTLVPAVVEYAAKVTDPIDTRSLGEKAIDPENKRQPDTIKEHVESAIPGLRENAPVKKPKGGHRQRPR